MDIYLKKALTTLSLLLGIIFIRLLLNKIFSSLKSLSREKKRKLNVNVNFISTIALIVTIVVIWSSQIQSMAISIIAFAVAGVIATKELIMCLTGTIYQSISHPFYVGDQIEIGEIRGQVIDRGLFSTKVLEIGPGDKTHQFTGRVITVPNSNLLLHNVLNESYFTKFVLHTFIVPLPIHVDGQKVEAALIKIAEKHVSEYYLEAEEYINKLQERSNLETPKIKARINIKIQNHEEIQFIVRVTIPFSEKGRIEQLIIKEFLEHEKSWLCKNS